MKRIDGVIRWWNVIPKNQQKYLMPGWVWVSKKLKKNEQILMKYDDYVRNEYGEFVKKPNQNNDNDSGGRWVYRPPKKPKEKPMTELPYFGQLKHYCWICDKCCVKNFKKRFKAEAIIFIKYAHNPKLNNPTGFNDKLCEDCFFKLDRKFWRGFYVCKVDEEVCTEDGLTHIELKKEKWPNKSEWYDHYVELYLLMTDDRKRVFGDWKILHENLINSFIEDNKGANLEHLRLSGREQYHYEVHISQQYPHIKGCVEYGLILNEKEMEVIER